MPKEGLRILFEKNSFGQNFLKPLYFWLFGQNYDKSSEPAELNCRRDACNSAKWPQYNPFEMGEKSFRILPTKNQNQYFSPKNAKNGQKIENFRKKFFWSKSIYNGPKRVLKWKYRVWKFLPVENFFQGHTLFSKNGTYESNDNRTSETRHA